MKLHATPAIAFSHDCHYGGWEWDVVDMILWSLIAGLGATVWPRRRAVRRFRAPIIGSRALALSDPYYQSTCLSVVLSFCQSFCHSVILSANLGLNISETRPDSGMVPMDSL